MKLFFITVLILFNSCNRFQQNTDLDIMAAINQDNYDFFSKSNNYNDIPLSNEKDLEKLKNLANKAIFDSNSASGSKSYIEFYEHVQYIMREYEGIHDFPVESWEKVSSPQFLIRTLEHVAINSVIRNFISHFYTFDGFSIIVVPERQNVRAGEIYNAHIYVACNDFYNPIKLIIENDTIEGSPNEAGPVFSIRTSQKGKFTQSAGLLIKSWGEDVVYPFVINYEVH